MLEIILFEYVVPAFLIIAILTMIALLLFFIYGACKSYISKKGGLTHQEEYIADLEKRLTVADETIVRITRQYVKLLKKD